MSGTDSSDLVSIIANQNQLTSEAFQNLTHSEQINYLKQHLLTSEAKIKRQRTNQRNLEKRNQKLQKDKQIKLWRRIIILNLHLQIKGQASLGPFHVY
jgi:hypothetical protein